MSTQSITTKERLSIIETKIDMILKRQDELVSRSTINILKWATGFIGSLAITAMLIAIDGK